MRLIAIVCTVVVKTTVQCSSQSAKTGPYLSNLVIIDSATSMMIPVLYNPGFFTSNKLEVWGNFYANIVFYNPQTDSSKRLFDRNTFITEFNRSYSYSKIDYGRRSGKNITSDWVLYRVKSLDHNKNGRIDKNDPDLLYISDVHGNSLKCLSTENESIVSVDIFEKQNFALLKFQRDYDQDGDYESCDTDYFYRKLDLKTLTLGNKIDTR